VLSVTTQIRPAIQSPDNRLLIVFNEKFVLHYLILL
jgi:hypothetical protein